MISFQKFWGVVDYYGFYYVISPTTPRVRWSSSMCSRKFFYYDYRNYYTNSNRGKMNPQRSFLPLLHLWEDNIPILLLHIEYYYLNYSEIFPHEISFPWKWIGVILIVW